MRIVSIENELEGVGDTVAEFTGGKSKKPIKFSYPERPIVDLTWEVLQNEENQRSRSPQSAPSELELNQYEVEIESSFDSWMCLLHHGFNLLIYGVGSKRVVLERFRKAKLENEYNIMIEGYRPTLSMLEVLRKICETMFDVRVPLRYRSDYIDVFKRETPVLSDLFIVIHNLDGRSLRDTRSQHELAVISEIVGVHMIVSVDHINAYGMWNCDQMNSFRWAWLRVSTWRQYSLEVNVDSFHTNAYEYRGCSYTTLVQVLNCLAPKATKLFILMAKYQVEHMNKDYRGISFCDLYEQSFRQFIITSETTIRTVLNEFRDHKIITYHRTKRGLQNERNTPFSSEELIRINLSNDDIKRFLNEFPRGLHAKGK
ncbi:hypothetical protein ACOME3_009278 [Neoechinorhynchus agilis]